MKKILVSLLLCLFLASPCWAAQLLKQSTSVTLKIGPFLDDSDGKTAETALTISQADVRLSKNGGNYAQKNDATSCTHDELGEYDCPLNGTDTGTLGLLKVMVQESGALAVWHHYVVVPANVYDSLVGGTDKLEADAVEISSDATAANNAELAFDTTGYGFTNCTMPTVTTLTGHTAQTGDSFAIVNNGTYGNAQLVRATTPANTLDVNATGEVGLDLDNTSGTLAKTTDITGFNDLSAAQVNSEVDTALADIDLDHLTKTALPTDPATDIALNSTVGYMMDNGTAWSFDRTQDALEALGAATCPDTASIADAVWDESSTGHIDAGKAGQQLWTDVDAVLVDTDDIESDLNDGVALTSTTETQIDNIETDTSAYDTDAEHAAAIWGADATTQQTQGTFGQAVGDPGVDSDTIWALCNTNLDATVSSRSTLSVSDNIGINWGDVSNPTTTVGLSNTTVGTVTTLTGHTAQTGDTYAALPTNFSDLSITVTTGRVDVASIEGVDATNQINTEADTALSDIDLDHLISSALPTPAITDIDAQSAFGWLLNKDGNWTDWDRTTDSTEGNAEAAGGATAAEVWAYGTRALTDKAGFTISGTKTTLDALNDVSTAEVNTEVDTGLSDIGLDHLLSASVVGADVTDNSVIAYMVSSSGTADWDSFLNTDDSLQAIRDRGDAAWTTGAGTGLTSLATGTAQAGAAGSITLAAGASGTTDLYKGARVLTTGGTGAGQSRMITAYNGGTKVASTAPNWVTNPSSDTTYEIQAADSSLGTIQNDNQSVTDLKDFADDGYDPATDKIQGVVLTDTCTTLTGHTAQTGDSYAIVNNGTYGNSALNTDLDTIIVDTDDIETDLNDGVALTATTEGQIDNVEADTNELQTNQNWNVWDDGTRALTDKAGFSLSASGIDAIWDETITGHATADSFGLVFDNQIDGLRTYGDTNWATAAGFSTHSAADVWTVGTRALTDKAGFTISGTKTTLDALNDVSTAQVQSNCETALTTYDLDHLINSALPSPAVSDIDAQSAFGWLLNVDGNWTGWDRTTDSTEGNAEAAGGATAAEVWGYGTRSLTDKAGFSISGTKQTLDALNDISTSDVLTQSQAALQAYDLDHLLNSALSTPAISDINAQSAFGWLLNKDGNWTDWDRTTDSGEGNAEAAGGATAAQVWTYGTRALTDKSGFSLSTTTETQIDDIDTNVKRIRR